MRLLNLTAGTKFTMENSPGMVVILAVIIVVGEVLVALDVVLVSVLDGLVLAPAKCHKGIYCSLCDVQYSRAKSTKVHLEAQGETVRCHICRQYSRRSTSNLN